MRQREKSRIEERRSRIANAKNEEMRLREER
jgi:hypothetical protein